MASHAYLYSSRRVFLVLSLYVCILVLVRAGEVVRGVVCPGVVQLCRYTPKAYYGVVGFCENVIFIIYHLVCR